MKKRIISAFLSSAIVMSTLGSMTGSAILCLDTEGSDTYKERIENYNEKYTSSPELTELADAVFPENVKNVWVRSKENSVLSDCIVEVTFPDRVSYFSNELPQNAEEIEAFVNEIKAELGYEDLIKLSAGKDGLDKYSGINLGFVEDNHQLNYMIAEKVYAIIKDKYEIRDINSIFASRQFLNRIVKRGLSFEGAADSELRDARMKEIYELVDHDMLKEKYRITLNEQGVLEFPEDVTVIEKFECFKYFADNYNVTANYETLASNDSMTIGETDFSEINYLDGDANNDKLMSIADAAAIFQSLANPDKYQLSAQGKFNADSKGDGLTVDDAVRIQKKLAGIK